MMIKQEKFLSKNEMREVIITRWIKPKGYKVSLCEFKNSTFPINLILVFGDIKEFAKLVKERSDYDVEHVNTAQALFVHVKNTVGEMDNYILITKNEWMADDYGTICHELHHFTHQALEQIGIDYGRAGEELFAYFQGHYMELVCRAFVELRKATRKKK